MGLFWTEFRFKKKNTQKKKPQNKKLISFVQTIFVYIIDSVVPEILFHCERGWIHRMHVEMNKLAWEASAAKKVVTSWVVWANALCSQFIPWSR